MENQNIEERSEAEEWCLKGLASVLQELADARYGDRDTPRDFIAGAAAGFEAAFRGVGELVKEGVLTAETTGLGEELSGAGWQRLKLLVQLRSGPGDGNDRADSVDGEEVS